MFYGAVFVTGLKHFNKRESWCLKAGDCESSDTDIEILNHSLFVKNQDKPKSERQADHFKIQQMLFTDYNLHEGNNIYSKK